jgi:hypothetical protein
VDLRRICIVLAEIVQEGKGWILRSSRWSALYDVVSGCSRPRLLQGNTKADVQHASVLNHICSYLLNHLGMLLLLL